MNILIKNIWILLLILSCDKSNELVGSYNTDSNNVIDMNLIINSDNTFNLTYRASLNSDSIFGNYQIDGNQIFLYSKTEELNLSSLKKNKTVAKEKCELNFIQSELSNDVDYYDSKLIINEFDTINIFSDFDRKTILVNRTDKLTYLDETLTSKVIIPDGDFDYDILIYRRNFYKIIPDTITIDFPQNNQIEVLNNKLNKTKA